MAAAFFALVRRDVVLALRVGGSGGLALVFFLMMVTVIPFAVGPDQRLIGRIGPSILWLAAVLAVLIGLDRLFRVDEEDGSLDLIQSTPLPLEVLVLAKTLAHWLTTALPLVVLSPLLGLLVALPLEGMAPLMLSLLLGTPALTCIGAVGAALTCTLSRGGLILAVLVMPLMSPVLIFGVRAVNIACGLIPGSLLNSYLMLFALTLLYAVIGAAAAAAALRNRG
ncbi:MAG: heme exporter protein CcmB [Methylobacteriaceae bacterium]|jgi:heme exporter protein B|nr:heme exporter protein CcmB [Methylobacteriaceae bacterium]